MFEFASVFSKKGGAGNYERVQSFISDRYLILLLLLLLLSFSNFQFESDILSSTSEIQGHIRNP